MFLSKTLRNAGILRYCSSVKSFRNLEEYIEAALATARFEKLRAGKRFTQRFLRFVGLGLMAARKDKPWPNCAMF
jgi:hypothetical protein